MSRVFIVAVPDEVNSQKEILGSPVIFSGVGKINAAMAAYQALRAGYKEIINIGSCGSMKLPPGQLVKVGQVFQDIDATPLSEYGYTPYEDDSKKIVLDVNFNTTCFTTDYFYDGNQRIKYSENYLKMVDECSIFDMECFAIAKVCKRFDMKFNSYKWVSDDGDASSWKEMCNIGFEKVKEVLNESKIS
jgi:adenosylhomocysteine nucleosidase